MARILIMMSVGSHQNATFFIAKQLRNSGNEVKYAGQLKGLYGEDLAQNVFNQGFEYEQLDLFRSRTEDLAAVRTTMSPIEEFESFESCLLNGKVFEEFIERTRPDLILLDVHLPIYAIVFSGLTVPLILISTELLTDVNSINPPISRLSMARSTVDVEQAWSGASRPLSKHVSRLVEALALKYNFDLKKVVPTCVVLFGLALPQLILWHEEFELNTNPRTPPNRKYIGSCIDQERDEPDFDWSNIDIRKPIVYCVLGTVIQNNKLIPFISNIVSSASLLPEFEFVFALGRMNEPEQVTVSSNVHFFKFVPQIRILKKASLTVCLAGGNTIKESLAFKVPLLCYPFHADQFGNAARVEFHKFGLIGDIMNETSGEIAKKIKMVITRRIGYSEIEQFNRTIHHQNTSISLDYETLKSYASR